MATHKRTPPHRGPGLLYIIAALVVVAVAGARFFGFSPGGDGPGRVAPRPPAAQPGEERGPGGILPDPARMTQVIVYHTHATENYSPKEAHATRGPGDVVAVGEAFVRALEKEGVAAVHIQTVHDLPQWSQAYDRARTSVQESLSRHKGIRVLVDIHRDGVERESPGFATATVNGEKVAKVLLVVGTTDNPLAAENLRFANRLQQTLEELAPGITRGVRVMARETNQDVHPNAVVAYVGDHKENTFEEAVRTAELLARAVAELLREDG